MILPTILFQLLSPLFVLAVAHPASASPRLAEANLLRPADFLPRGIGTDPDGITSLLRYPEGDWHAVYAASLEWNGLLRREGRAFGEIAGGRADQAVWARPMPMLDLALTWSGTLERARYLDAEKIDARLGESRTGRGLAVVYHLGNPAGKAGTLLDLALAIPDVDRQGYAWALSIGRRGRWRAEYALEREDVDEPFLIVNLDTSGSGERVPGSYRGGVLSQRLSGAFPAVGGRVSLEGAYAAGTPRHPDPGREYWFSDSSRRIDAAARYARPFAWGSWNARAVYRESEVLTFGRRIPPGSEGLKRFHYARSHARLWEAGVGRDPGTGSGAGSGTEEDSNPDADIGSVTGPLHGPMGLSLGAVYRDLSWRTTPSQDALGERNETLSYNRLGLSFIANLYGGLFKESEILSGRLHAGCWEARADWRGAVGGNDAGGGPGRRWSGLAGLSLFRTGFGLDWEGRSLSQRLFSVDTSAAYGGSPGGSIVGLAPRLGAAWSLGRFRAEWAVSQVLPLSVEVHGAGGGPGAGKRGSAADYPPFRNGFSSWTRLEAGF